jgi:hypothetical protein
MKKLRVFLIATHIYDHILEIEMMKEEFVEKDLMLANCEFTTPMRA